MRKIISEINQRLVQGECLVLASIIEHSGSTPRSSGTRMVIHQDGSIYGTIGGGLLEAKVRSLGASVFQTKQTQIEKIAFTGQDAAQSDMICGGEVTVLLEWVDSTNIGNCATIDEIKRELALLGSAYIFGAGHVSQSLAKLTGMVGFYTVVVDDRAEYANQERFPAADEILTPNPIQSAFDTLLINETSYIVIVTRGHLQDHQVLERALQTSARYIGMIGSVRKCALIYEALRANGWGENDLMRINAPIGIKIKAETPEEIAVSIVAEMIHTRALSRS